MSMYEEVVKQRAFGIHGEFTVGKGARQLRACYIETKIRPGSDGTWDNILASQLVPWREIFDLEKVSFDELLQRDLNDSRVAHDLIPYLLGTEGNSARFFPPILVVLVPKNDSGSGIASSYPNGSEENGVISFGSVFDLKKEPTQSGGFTPFGSLEYNPQRSSFIIVDGQHRAMAVLALHRQLTKSWQGSNFESYYKHIDVSPQDVRRLELPVCIVVFPDLRDGSDHVRGGMTLDKACRELFLVVNRKAQPVSQARNLLLDDDDFGALLMRRTLSKFKGRTEDQDGIARIYSFRYSDSEDEGRAVQSGRLEYSSAVFLHKLQCIGAFGNPKGFTWDSTVDLSSGLQCKNSTRPVEILVGTKLQSWSKVTRNSARSHDPADVHILLELLGDLVDIPILRLFDSFLPFAAHNRAMRRLRTRLSEPTLRADAVQFKAFTLLFEGSGSKEVFDEHIERLSTIKRDWEEEKRKVSDYVANQLQDARDVQRALQLHERNIKRERACELFAIRYNAFYPDRDADSSVDQSALEQKARSVYDTIATQAFQIGYLTAVLTIVEQDFDSDRKYDDRKKLVAEVTELLILSMNEFFQQSSAIHNTLSGLVLTERANVFSTSGPGLRKLLGMSVTELNEKQWPFFRYLICEIVFSKFVHKGVLAWVDAKPISERRLWLARLEKLDKAVADLRGSYIERAIKSGLADAGFQDGLRLLRAEMKGRGVDETQINAEVAKREAAERKRLQEQAEDNVRASVGGLTGAKKLLTRVRSMCDLPLEEGDAIAVSDDAD